MPLKLKILMLSSLGASVSFKTIDLNSSMVVVPMDTKKVVKGVSQPTLHMFTYR